MGICLASSGIFDRTHLRFFTKRYARQLFDTTGWSIVVKSRNPQSLKGQVASRITLRLFDNFMAYLAVLFRSGQKILADLYVWLITPKSPPCLSEPLPRHPPVVPIPGAIPRSLAAFPDGVRPPPCL